MIHLMSLGQVIKRFITGEKLIKNHLEYKRQFGYYKKVNDNIIGRVALDFLVEEKIVIELKRGNYFSRKNIEQIYNYLIITDKRLGILANFTSRGVKFKRILNL